MCSSCQFNRETLECVEQKRIVVHDQSEIISAQMVVDCIEKKVRVGRTIKQCFSDCSKTVFSTMNKYTLYQIIMQVT